MSEAPAPDRAREADPQGILAAFLSLPSQVTTSFADAREAPAEPFAPATITFCGMGGSAAAGDVVAAAYRDRLLIPVLTHRGYGVPAHCDRDDLVVCLSYSGSTEEALSALEDALARGCRVVTVSAGGRLAERGASGGALVREVAGGPVMPRAALGQLAGAALGALASLGAIPDPAEDVEEVGSVVGDLAQELAPEGGGGDAARLAEWIGGRLPVVWGSTGLAEPAAWRWKCAFNENAKVPAFASSLPELDHHEIAGWSDRHGEGFALVVLRHPAEHPSVGPRTRASLESVATAGLEAREVHARGTSALTRVLSLILVGDAASTYHAMSRGIDPTPIEAIDRVKSRLEGR